MNDVIVDDHRVTVVMLIRDSGGRVFVGKTPKDSGVFPGQWGIPGGGIEPSETMIETVRRETREEVGLELEIVEPWYFADDVQRKYKPDGTYKIIYMIYLYFECIAKTTEVELNKEYEEFAWVLPKDLQKYDFNEATLKTFKRRGWID